MRRNARKNEDELANCSPYSAITNQTPRKIKAKVMFILEKAMSTLEKVMRTLEKVMLTLEKSMTAREQRYSSILSLASTLDVGVWSRPRPVRFTLSKETRYPLYRKLGGPMCRCERVPKTSSLPGSDPLYTRSFQVTKDIGRSHLQSLF